MVHELVRYMKSVNMHGEKIKEKTAGSIHQKVQVKQNVLKLPSKHNNSVSM